MVEFQRVIKKVAVYTRKSSEEGIDQAFNSMDAQREMGEQFAKSQSGEGWAVLPERFDDGGYSGGTLNRPALQRLLTMVNAGQVDVILVYKIDRLSRSIVHFHEIMQVLESKGVAFASVTQQLNTTTSMGRMVVNLLMSFAQFERELASERTRDKIALSRQKGRWAGGRAILGYDLAPGGTLTVNKFEAERVRVIFDLYIELKSLDKVLARLVALGWKNKATKSAAGRESGGGPFMKTSLARLIQSPLYVGRIAHHDKVFAGIHEPIVEEQVWNQAQAIMGENRVCGGSTARDLYGGLLKGITRCDCGSTMMHTTTKKPSGTVYRYYTCKGKSLGSTSCRATLPAEQLEQLVLREVKKRGFDPELVTMIFDAARKDGEERIAGWNAELKTLERESGWIATEIRRQIVAREDTSHASEREVEVAAKIKYLNQQIREESSKLVTRAQVQAAADDFDPLWRNLTPSERSTVIKLIISRVDYHAKTGEIKIHFADLASAQEAAA